MFIDEAKLHCALAAPEDRAGARVRRGRRPVLHRARVRRRHRRARPACARARTGGSGCRCGSRCTSPARCSTRSTTRTRKRGADGKPLGIVHRDISPSNVFISRRGDVKLGDFGIARAAEQQRQSKTQAGTLKGKYGYMSPEQVVGGEIDGRSDLFAVGIVLAEMLMGRRLFTAPNDLDVLLMVRDARLDRLDQYGGDIPPPLRKILDRMLARDPDDALPTAGATARRAAGVPVRVAAARQRRPISARSSSRCDDRADAAAIALHDARRGHARAAKPPSARPGLRASIRRRHARQAEARPSATAQSARGSRRCSRPIPAPARAHRRSRTTGPFVERLALVADDHHRQAAAPRRAPRADADPGRGRRSRPTEGRSRRRLAGAAVRAARHRARDRRCSSSSAAT